MINKNNHNTSDIWGVSRQLPQRAARKPQIVLFLTHVYDTKMYLKKLFCVYIYIVHDIVHL